MRKEIFNSSPAQLMNTTVSKRLLQRTWVCVEIIRFGFIIMEGVLFWMLTNLNLEIVVRYEDPGDKPAAVIKTNFGQGTVVLSGVHW